MVNIALYDYFSFFPDAFQEIVTRFSEAKHMKHKLDKFSISQNIIKERQFNVLKNGLMAKRRYFGDFCPKWMSIEMTA